MRSEIDDDLPPQLAMSVLDGGEDENQLRVGCCHCQVTIILIRSSVLDIAALVLDSGRCGNLLQGDTARTNDEVRNRP